MKLNYIGWQIGINYQAPQKYGIDWPYLKNVIDRSADAGMNFISLMMISYAYFCPEHDGYAWPVKNPRLDPLRDTQCLNANAKTEFAAKALAYAKSKGFHCQLIMNSMIWNPARVIASYPQAESQCYADGEKVIDGWMFCPDSPGGWQLAVDEVIDLLEFYSGSPVDSFCFERLGYDNGTCFCQYSLEKFKRMTGTDLPGSPLSHLVWKGNAVRELLKKYVSTIREARPGIEIWAHTGGEPEWGHFPHVIRDIGIDAVSNHGQHFLSTQGAFHQQLDWLWPLPCVPHICVRDIPTHNYPVPIRTPEMIREYGNWLRSYPGLPGEASAKPGDRVQGAMFFNEVATSEQNKAAVYEMVRNW